MRLPAHNIHLMNPASNPFSIPLLYRIVHEYLHGFKLKDLYDMDTDDKRLVIGGTGKCLLISYF